MNDANLLQEAMREAVEFSESVLGVARTDTPPMVADNLVGAEKTFKTVAQRIANVHRALVRDGHDANDVSSALFLVVIEQALHMGATVEDLVNAVIEAAQ